MQRKNTDIADNRPGCHPQNHNQYYHHSSSNHFHTQKTHQPFFMKYASSIIQVVSEDHLQKQSHQEIGLQHRIPAAKVSSDNYYQTQKFPKNNQNTAVRQNNYNGFGERFKKQNNKKHVLVYTFTNITFFMKHLIKIQNNLLKKVFNSFKSSFPKQLALNPHPPKSKSSFHSDYTASTSNQDHGLKKLNHLQILKKNEIIKQSIDQIKGWIQFKLLIVKKEAFKLILAAKAKTICTKQSNLMPNFELSSFQNDESFTILRQRVQESLAYTVDQNYQFSQKEFTASPYKVSLEEQHFLHLLANKQPKIATSTYGPINNNQSIVEAYRFSKVKSNKVTELSNYKVAEAKPIPFKLDKQRKHLVLRTNTFQLPLISQFYLKDGQISICKPIPLIKDVFSANQIGSHLNNEQIKKQFQAAQKALSKDQPSLKKGQQKLKNNTLEDKQYTLMEQTKRNTNIQSVKNIKQAQISVQKTTYKMQSTKKIPLNQEAKGLHKLQDYYFPGVQSKTPTIKHDMKYLTDKKVSKESQRISFQISGQKQGNSYPNKAQIGQGISSGIPFQNESKQKEIDKHVMLERQQKKTHQVTFQNKNKPRINVQFNSPQHNKLATSPQNINLQSLGKNEMQRKNFYSPPSTLPNFNTLNQPKNNQAIGKAIQIEYNQVKSPEQTNRFSTKDKMIPHQTHNGMYQLNSVNQSRQPVINRINFPKNEPANIKNQSPFKQILQPMNTKTNNYNIPSRATACFAPSPFPPSLHLNTPVKNESFAYGMATSRDSSQKKAVFHFPQQQRNSFTPNNMPQPVKHQFQKFRRQDYNQQYFAKDPRINKLEDKAINFNNNYYSSGVSIPSRTNQMISPINVQSNYPQDSKARRAFISQRPHSSFKETAERFNIFSNYSPMESQLQYIQRSNNFTRNSSQLSRPKSMNEKIFVTMRREY